MLRKRSRGMTSPQAIVVDHNNNSNSWLPHEKSTKPTSFLFNSPKFFKGFFSSSKVSDSPIMSPTSILDTKPISTFSNSFWVVDNNIKNPTTQQHSWEQPNNTKGIGLALITEPNNNSNSSNNNNNNSINNTTTITKQQQKRKLVVFGSQLKIQVPPTLPQSSVFPCFSPDSPREFGIKTPRNHNLWCFGNKDSQVHPQNLSPIEKNGIMISGKGNEKLSLSDMELSEDYTCVIHNGPNPKTTHIFENCIVESCCGVVGSSTRRNGDSIIPSYENFLSFCHHCKKKLGEGSDIYMYRGEKAFCSQECRCQEMLFDGVES